MLFVILSMKLTVILLLIELMDDPAGGITSPL
jgi:hypothetical protein